MSTLTYDELSFKYGYGDCAVFAAGLHRMTALPIVEFYEGNELFHVAVVIEGASMREDRFIDVFGKCTATDIRKRYGVLGKVQMESKTEQELHSTSSFTESDVQAAITHIQWMNEHHLFNGGTLSGYMLPIEKNSKQDDVLSVRPEMQLG